MLGIEEKSGRTILVVDDEQGVSETLELALKHEGYHVHTLSSGVLALTWLKENKADILLLDIKMPQMNGIEFLRELRKMDKEMIVIMMTAYSTISDAREAMLLGAYDFITKPFDLEIIKALLQESLTEKNA